MFNLAIINNLSSSTDPLRLTFKLAYQGRSNLANEKLQVFSSNNCGQTWSLRYSKAMSTLTTVGNYSSSPFTPSSLSDWRTEQISISSLLNTQHMLFKFQFTSDANGLSNNIYIDDINLSRLPVVGIEENNFTQQINVFPNPVNQNNFTLDFVSEYSSELKIKLIDIQSKEILNIEEKLNIGENKINVNLPENCASGIYFLSITSKDFTHFRKIIVQQKNR